MNSREELKIKALETLEIIERGWFEKGKDRISCGKDLKHSIEGATLYSPKQTYDIVQMLKPNQDKITKIEVRNETTLHAAQSLKEEGYEKVLCLNFASAKNPGGGFLNGSMAQEESIVISSGLYPTLLKHKTMYEYNRKLQTCLYSDYMIYSPDVPVFRNDFLELIYEPFNVSFVTAPAVNAGIVRKETANKNRIHSEMEKRITKILALGLHLGYKTIVLGAFGCGVFKNNPEDVAGYFHKILSSNPKIQNQYEKVVFAVLDKSEHQQTYNTFKEVLLNSSM